MTSQSSSDKGDGRLHHALIAYVRQEFEAPVGAIVGYAEIMLDDARRGGLDELDTLERLHQSGLKLKELVTGLLVPQAVPEEFPDFRRRLRHDLRSTIGVVKGLGEMLKEEAEAAQSAALLQDVDKLLSASARLLAQVDALVEFHGSPGASAARQDLEDDAMSAVLDALGPALDRGRDAGVSSRILVVDDTAATRDLLSRRLRRDGHDVCEAENGRTALVRLAAEPFDLVLLDMMMPDISGYEVLTRLKTDPKLRHIPVIVISALDEIDSVVRCIEAGAEDYLSKPFDPILLRARIGASLEKKRLRDREQQYLADLHAEKDRSEALLLNILPRSIVLRMQRGETNIAERFQDVTVLFSDIVGFTRLSMRRSASEVVEMLNAIFSAVDRLALEHGVEKIKTIGDAYMAVAGLPEPHGDHAPAIARLALAVRGAVDDIARRYDEDLKVRIGIHSGSAVAGVIGTHKFAFDVWGDTVNTASAMESHGIADEIQVSHATYLRLFRDFVLVPRGLVEIKGKGPMETYLLRGERARN